MFRKTKPGSDEYDDTQLFMKHLIKCVYNRRLREEMIKIGQPIEPFSIKLKCDEGEVEGQFNNRRASCDSISSSVLSHYN